MFLRFTFSFKINEWRFRTITVNIISAHTKSICRIGRQLCEHMCEFNLGCAASNMYVQCCVFSSYEDDLVTNYCAVGVFRRYWQPVHQSWMVSYHADVDRARGYTWNYKSTGKYVFWMHVLQVFPSQTAHSNLDPTFCLDKLRCLGVFIPWNTSCIFNTCDTCVH